MSRANMPQVSTVLFVGGLSSSTTEKQINDYLRPYTEVLSVKIAQDRKLKQSKGYAMVKVPDVANLDQLLTTRHNINGRRVDIQLAAKRSEKQQCQDEIKKRKLFVRDINKHLNNEDFEREISKNPLIRSGYIIRDYYTGESKGYGYLQLVSAEAANTLIDQGLTISGAPVTLVPYKYKYEPKPQPSSKDTVLSPASAHSPPEHSARYSRQKSAALKNDFVRTDSLRDEGDEAITMKVEAHGNSSSNSSAGKGSAQTPATTVRKNLDHLKVCSMLDESSTNLRFNGWTQRNYPVLF